MSLSVENKSLPPIANILSIKTQTFDDEIFEPPVGETPLWQHVTVTALFAIGADESAIKESLQQTIAKIPVPEP
jgi:hypothetical protein